MMNIAKRINYDLGRFGVWQIMIRLVGTFHSLPHKLWAWLFINFLYYDTDTDFSF